MPKQTLILDSSQISCEYECHEKWLNSYVRNLIQINKKEPARTFQPSDAIAAGSLGHKYLEIYYTSIGKSIRPEDAVKQALAFNPDEADKQDTQFPLDLKLRSLVRTRFCDYMINYYDDYEVALRRRPIVSINESGLPIDSYELEPLVEKGFSYKLFESAEYLFVLEGRIDLITIAAGQTAWVDHKWQLRAHTLYNKSIQFKNYAMVTGLTLGIINYIRLQQTVGPDTFRRQPISFSPHELAEWKEELIERYVHISKLIKSELTYYNRDACAGKYGQPCQFVSLCEEYNLQTRTAVRERDFTIKKEWRPW